MKSVSAPLKTAANRPIAQRSTGWLGPDDIRQRATQNRSKSTNSVAQHELARPPLLHHPPRRRPQHPADYQKRKNCAIETKQHKTRTQDHTEHVPHLAVCFTPLYTVTVTRCLLPFLEHCLLFTARRSEGERLCISCVLLAQ